MESIADNASLVGVSQKRMLELTACAASPADLWKALVERSLIVAALEGAVYLTRVDDGQLSPSTALVPPTEDSSASAIVKRLTQSGGAACKAGDLVVQHMMAPSRIMLATPIARRGAAPEAIAASIRTSESLGESEAVAFIQMAASHLVLWHVMAACREEQSDAQAAAALVELLAKIVDAGDIERGCLTLTAELRSYLQCDQAAIGLVKCQQGPCRLSAVSGMTKVDRHSDTAGMIESAMDESFLRGTAGCWPPMDGQAYAMKAHQSLCEKSGAARVITLPICHADGRPVAAIALLGEFTSPERTLRFLEASASPLGKAICSLQTSSRSVMRRWIDAARKSFGQARGKAGIALMLFVIASLLIPVPHRIKSDCRVEPVTRRFVAAPFDSTLDRSLVEPGDLVKGGQLLARLDARDLSWKRASVAADQEQAIKRRDAAQASREYADQRIAQLEVDRLALELKLLDHRTANLEIRSPIGGVVASGDLERTEGAPLATGQTLFEIAPLDAMVIEIAVEHDDVAHVKPGQTIFARIDAYPGAVWTATVDKIQPRSEIYDDRNVFVVDAHIDNQDGRLRPGMKGRAKIHIERRALGWILFHKPVEFLTKTVCW